MRLGEALGQFVRAFIKPELVRGTVKSVNKNNKTCIVEPTDGGADYTDVKLTAAEGNNVDAVVMYPKVGSTIFLATLEGNSTDTFVAQMTEVEEVVFHDGKNGGIAITPELVTQLSRMTARIDRLESAIKGGIAAVPPAPPDSGNALIGSMKALLATPLLKEDFSKVENEKIKH